MATAKKKKEKEQFFEDLSRLDRFVDDGEEDEPLPKFRPTDPRPPPPRPVAEGTDPSINPRPVQTPRVGVLPNGTHRKRKASEKDSMPPPSTIKPPETKTKTKAKPQTARSFSSPVRETEKPRQQALKRTKSHLDNPNPLWRKGDIPLKTIAEDKKVFQGLVFYFIPDREDKLIDPLFRHRIRVSIQYGAIWANKFSSDVTHIVVCDDLNYSQVSRFFYDEKVPTGPTLILIDWVVETVSRRYPPDINSTRFQVEGSSNHGKDDDEDDHDSDCEILTPWEEKMVRDSGMIDSGMKAYASGEPERSSSNAQYISTKMSKPANELLEAGAGKITDDLQKAINDVQKLGTIPLHPSFDGGQTSAYDVDDDLELSYLKEDDKAKKGNSGFLCMEKHDGNEDNPNATTIEVLQQMATYYDRTGDRWRTMAYRKAISALGKQRQLIRSKEEARTIPQIGDSLAEKIEEIVTTNRLRKLEYTKLDLNDQVLQLFMGIYQVGYPTASKWIAQGHRTLDDLRQNVDLNTNQRIGLEHYDDFQQRIPRAEVAQHAAVVEKALKTANDGLQMIVGGSYRRGNKDSGDIDLIITKEGASLELVRTLIMELVIPALTDQGFLKVKLAGGEAHEQASKWHGASALPGAKTWRRIDLLFVPWAELGAALIYFTGNDIFNRSLRLLASRKQMRLNQHGLYADVMRGRGRERITDGKLLEGQDERRIFEILGVPYLPPEHRKC